LEKIRYPAVAGTFYPSSPDRLEKDIQEMLDGAVIDFKIDNLFGIVVPHAGYIYSGKTAAFAYNLLRDKEFETVIVISPSHYEYFNGSSVFDGDAYETPLGKIPINKEKCDHLVSDEEFVYSGNEGHRVDLNHQEHALEVQLPFIQTLLKDFSLVPIVIGNQNKNYINSLANALFKIIDDKTLIVTSTDLSHFLSKENANIQDSLVEKHISNLDPDSLQIDLENNSCSACGGGGVVALMKAARLKSIPYSKVIARSDSGDVSGDNSGVVGYLSAVIYS